MNELNFRGLLLGVVLSLFFAMSSTYVGLYAGRDGDRVRPLGGNQGNQVNVASFDLDRVIAKRLP